MSKQLLLLVTSWFATVLLIIFFGLVGSIKLFGWHPEMAQNFLGFFESYGLNREMMAVVGAMEFFGALALFLHRRHWLAAYGALAIVITSMGAIGFHLIFDGISEGIPAIITLILSAFVLSQNKELLKARFMPPIHTTTE